MSECDVSSSASKFAKVASRLILAGSVFRKYVSPMLLKSALHKAATIGSLGNVVVVLK
jgi:hypothetical protein